MLICFAKSGRVFKVSGSEITLRDDNCVWDHDGVMYFTRKGWNQYLERQEILPESIDKLRDM